MTKSQFSILLAVGIDLTIAGMVSAGQVAGIVRMDGQPMETGPFESQTSAAGPEITHQFQSMYLTTEPDNWTKAFRWEIPGNAGLFPGNTLSIIESIPLIYPAGINTLVQLPISDWHETIASGDLSGFFVWDSQSPNTHISARIGNQQISIHPSVNFSSDGKSISFDFDPIQIPTQAGMSSVPVTLDILKQVRWNGPVLDPLPTPHYIDVLVSEYPSTPGPIGDYNQNGIVDAADYTVWRKTDGSQTGYNCWRSNFGDPGSGGGSVHIASVPEPASALLWILGAAVGTWRRRRIIS